MMEMEDSFAKGEAMSATGGVYFAWSPCLKCMKIGATRKEDPHVRLRQISSFVTSPFILAAWFPTPTPFRLEVDAHLHFKQQRINQRGSGAGTEFFRIKTVQAVEYVARVGEHASYTNEDVEFSGVDDELCTADKLNDLQLALDQANEKLTSEKKRNRYMFEERKKFQAFWKDLSENLAELKALFQSQSRKKARYFQKQATKLNEALIALDQEKQKSAANTQAYTAVLKEKDQVLQRLRDIFG